MKYEFVDKGLFFPEKGILAIADLHLGYENMLKQEGIDFPLKQLEQSKKDIEKIILKIGKEKIKKIIILGDLKHHFNFDVGEKFEVRNFLKFLEKFVSEENIILLKGNHEKIELDRREYKFFHIEGDIAFVHGDQLLLNILDKDVKTIVMGHLHPALNISDKPGIKKEKYKCFLVGKWKKKDVIILPSFFSFREGTDPREDYEGDYSFIPKKDLLKFEAFVVGEEGVLSFGKLERIKT